MFLFAHDSSSAEFVGKLLDKSAILDVTISKMDFLIKKLHSDPMAKDALTDMFKYIYSMILHYSRAQSGKQTVMGEAWCDKFSVYVLSLLLLCGMVLFIEIVTSLDGSHLSFAHIAPSPQR